MEHQAATAPIQLDNTEIDVQIFDHMCGFDINFRNYWLDTLPQRQLNVWTQTVFNSQVRNNYPQCNFRLDINLDQTSHHVLSSLEQASVPTEKNFNNFLCCFNGNYRLDRMLLISALHKMGWFNFEVSSKNFVFEVEDLIEIIRSYTTDHYIDSIVDNQDVEFYKKINSFDYEPYNHIRNIHLLAPKINQSFIHLVSETLAASYHPFTSEKIIQPIVCKNIWVAYAQPSYHTYLEKYYGFKLYRIFDYSFDSIINPVYRLVELIKMISKYSTLSKHDWYDLYQQEQDITDYNYDWYYSGQYLKNLELYTDHP